MTDPDSCPICFAKRDDLGVILHLPGCPDKPAEITDGLTPAQEANPDLPYRYSRRKMGMTNASDEAE